MWAEALRQNQSLFDAPLASTDARAKLGDARLSVLGKFNRVLRCESPMKGAALNVKKYKTNTAHLTFKKPNEVFKQ